jgi:glycerol-3-phosphate acyltransferase PlsY
MYLGGYLVGSLPTAYLVVRKRSGSDIRTQGSGNVGSLNAYVVTRSKALGIAVGLIDGMKGLLPVGVAALLRSPFWLLAALLFGAITGHICTIWLRFRGGRGLATACGGLLLLSPPYVLSWCTIWLVWKFLGREVLTANLLAIILTPLVLFLVPGEALAFIPIEGLTAGSARVFALLISLLLLLGHLNALPEICRDLFLARKPSANQ